MFSAYNGLVPKRKNCSPLTHVLIEEDQVLPALTVKWVWRTPKSWQQDGFVTGYIKIGDEVLSVRLRGTPRGYLDGDCSLILETTHDYVMGGIEHSRSRFSISNYAHSSEKFWRRSQTDFTPARKTAFIEEWTDYLSLTLDPLSAQLVTHEIYDYLSQYRRVVAWPEVPEFRKTQLDQVTALEASEIALDLPWFLKDKTMGEGVAFSAPYDTAYRAALAPDESETLQARLVGGEVVISAPRQIAEFSGTVRLATLMEAASHDGEVTVVATEYGRDSFRLMGWAKVPDPEASLVIAATQALIRHVRACENRGDRWA